MSSIKTDGEKGRTGNDALSMRDAIKKAAAENHRNNPGTSRREWEEMGRAAVIQNERNQRNNNR